ncbi:MAG: response regulator transcription factor [Xanthomonadales bacterium]|nr:response regulator transcription factor [Xanthomonadales bacterium]MBL0222144.1 response regulator transcription factor [Xanthomonadales bacterium]HQV73169.1 response regulator transcription factor [Dokdonella sp.]HQW76464.1 response regulator transcription factor [Dokdonella sp.]HQZ62371.1 response regulator transcription factor [Dokdonella sp.]
MTRILVVDDHPLFRLALVQAVGNLEVETEIIEADGLDSAREVLGRRADVDLILLDLHMPGSHGLMGLVSLRSEFPAVAVIMISANDDPLVMRRALTYGAAGFIPKRSSIGEIQSMLRAVIACEDLPPSALNDRHGSEAAHDRELAKRLATLSPQQLRVLGLVADGLLNKQIADRLDIQERTVKAHMSAVFERLDVRNRTQASTLLRSLEIADPSRTVAD